MDFTTKTRTIQKLVKKISKKSYDYGVCGTKDEWKVISITPDEVQIDIDNMLREGEPSPNIKITNNPTNKDYPYHILVSDVNEYSTDTVDGYMELAEPASTGPFRTIEEALTSAGEYMISNIL